jgi:predicted dienelactone hydrolase
MDGRPVVAWYPNQVDHPLPLVLFSHGFGGANIQSMSLMRALAGAGYLVLAPNHRDAASWLGGEGKSGLQASFGNPDGWSAETFKDRYQDLLAVYRAIPKEPRLAALYKDGPVILAGHSLGGYTALGMAGARPGWEYEIQPAGVIALSPYCAPYVRSGSLSRLKAPVMYQGGTLDSGLTPTVARSGGAYDQTPTPKVFVNFGGATHASWTELRPQYQPQISQYAIAFCNRFAKGMPKDPLGEKLAGVDELRTADL